MPRKRYSLKQRFRYHSRIANTGKTLDGRVVNTVTRVRHANRAEEIRQQQNAFMQGVNFANRNCQRINRVKR